MKVIRYQVDLEEPAIFAALEGDPNSAVSYPYIPGSAVRGMLIGREIKRRGAAIDAGDTDIRACFFSSMTRYLNAYLVINGGRSLPVPATWTTPKYQNAEERADEQLITITDSALADTAITESERRKPKAVSGFAVVGGDNALIHKPDMQINVHTRRARRDASDQQVFRYEALAPKQSFGGVILCDHDDNADWLVSLLESDQQMAFGGSRTAGYGRAMLTHVEVLDAWEEAPTSSDKDTLILTFLSDALLRDTWGNDMPLPVAVEAILANYGITYGEFEPRSLKTTWVGGFNRKWGLPLPQQLAIEAGSVVRLNHARFEDPSAISNLHTFGIGERREDGFGRVALGWQQQPYLTRIKVDEKIDHTTTQAVTLTNESEQLWTLFADRFAAQKTTNTVSQVIFRIDSPYKVSGGGLTRTQISRLRSIIANELRKSSPNRAALSQFITSIQGKAAGRQFDNARILNRPLSEWVSNPQFAEVPADIMNNDRNVLQLVDAVMERAYLDSEQAAKGGR